MSTVVTPASRLLTSARDAEQARIVLATLEGPDGFLSVADHPAATEPLPRELGVLLQQVLRAVADGGSVTVTAIPAVVTTTAAAALLGVSRPTLMRMVNAGEIPAHKVGSHTRLRSEDVLTARRERRERERRAFEDLQALLDD